MLIRPRAVAYFFSAIELHARAEGAPPFRATRTMDAIISERTNLLGLTRRHWRRSS
jgi:hypothetical protein